MVVVMIGWCGVDGGISVLVVVLSVRQWEMAGSRFCASLCWFVCVGVVVYQRKKMMMRERRGMSWFCRRRRERNFFISLRFDEHERERDLIWELELLKFIPPNTKSPHNLIINGITDEDGVAPSPSPRIEVGDRVRASSKEICKCVSFGWEKIEKREVREIRDLRRREMRDLRCRVFNL